MFSNLVLGLAAVIVGMSVWIGIDTIQIERLEEDVISLNKEIVFQKQRVAVVELEDDARCEILMEKEKAYEKIPDSIGEYNISFP